jgi:hypothetical protein
VGRKPKADLRSPDSMTAGRRALAVLNRRLQEREVRPVEEDSTPAPVWHGRDWTDPDDYCAPSVAVLPDGPDTLMAAAAAAEEEEAAV